MYDGRAFLLHYAVVHTPEGVYTHRSVWPHEDNPDLVWFNEGQNGVWVRNWAVYAVKATARHGNGWQIWLEEVGNA